MPRPPSRGRVTDSFGWRIHPITGAKTFHYGEDTVGAGNYAPVTGTVIRAGYFGGLGNLVVIREAATPSILWLVGHHKNLAVTAGQACTEGATFLGEIGSTGNSTGDHAHTERRVGGTATNPQAGTATNPRDFYIATAGGNTTPIPTEGETLVPILIRNADTGQIVLGNIDTGLWVGLAQGYPELLAAHRVIATANYDSAPNINVPGNVFGYLESVAVAARGTSDTTAITDAIKSSITAALKDVDVDEAAIADQVLANLPARTPITTPELDAIAQAVRDRIIAPQ